MAVFSTLKLFGAPLTTPADAGDLSQHVDKAYALLRSLHARGVQVPADVVAAIIDAQRSPPAQRTTEMETRFWNAYGLLGGGLQLADQARSNYRRIFYVVLAALLFGQFFYLAGDSVRVKLVAADADNAAQHSVLKSDDASDADYAAAKDRIEKVKQQRAAFIKLGDTIVAPIGGLIDLPLRLFGMHSFFSSDLAIGPGAKLDEDEQAIIERGQLEIMLTILSGYLLPMLYGLLGACAFVLRKLTDEIGKLTYAHDARVRYTLRLNVGMLSGLAVGWFTKGPTDATISSLSPLALAFVSGYGSELLFIVLDKIVAAFAPPTAAGSSTVTTTTAGGLTTTTAKVTDTAVAADRLSPDGAAAKAPDASVQTAGPSLAGIKAA